MDGTRTILKSLESGLYLKLIVFDPITTLYQVNHVWLDETTEIMDYGRKFLIQFYLGQTYKDYIAICECWTGICFSTKPKTRFQFVKMLTMFYHRNEKQTCIPSLRISGYNIIIWLNRIENYSSRAENAAVQKPFAESHKILLRASEFPEVITWEHCAIIGHDS